MRIRIPLVLACAALVAMSCDQQPTEPQTQESAVPALFASQGNGAYVSISEFPFDFNLCGYTDVTCNVREHTIVRDAEDASGASHFVYHSTWRGTCTSPETGENWRLVGDDLHFVRQIDDPGHFLFNSAGVGIGHAPNFKARFRCPYYEVEGGLFAGIDWENCKTDYVCEEFGN